MELIGDRSRDLVRANLVAWHCVGWHSPDVRTDTQRMLWAQLGWRRRVTDRLRCAVFAAQPHPFALTACLTLLDALIPCARSSIPGPRDFQNPKVQSPENPKTYSRSTTTSRIPELCISLHSRRAATSTIPIIQIPKYNSGARQPPIRNSRLVASGLYFGITNPGILGVALTGHLGSIS